MRLFLFCLLAVPVLLLMSCASQEPVKTAIVAPPPPPVKTEAPEVIDLARDLLGAPYRYGGNSPKGFDCSGLVHYVYQRAGIRVPRTSAEQYRQANKVPLNALRSGDLLFFRLSPPKVSHVGIYDRNGRFIHAPSSGGKVSYASLDLPYWREHLFSAGRF